MCTPKHCIVHNGCSMSAGAAIPAERNHKTRQTTGANTVRPMPQLGVLLGSIHYPNHSVVNGALGVPWTTGTCTGPAEGGGWIALTDGKPMAKNCGNVPKIFDGRSTILRTTDIMMGEAADQTHATWRRQGCASRGAAAQRSCNRVATTHPLWNRCNRS